MPLFLYISGLFHKNDKIVNRSIFYCSVGFLTKILISVTDALTVPRGGGIPGFSLLSDAGIPWFMFVLAVFTLLAYSLRKQNKLFILIMSTVLACFVGYDKTISDYLYLSRSIIFFPFYWLGTMASADDWIRLRQCNNTKRITAIAISLIAILAWAYVSFEHLDTFYVYRHLFTGRNPFSDEVIAYGPLARLMCYGISILTCAALIILTPAEKIAFVSDAGTRTINVLVWHWPVYMLLQKVFTINALFLTTSGKTAFLCIAVLVAVVLSAKPFKYPVHWVKQACFKENKESIDKKLER